MKLDPKQPYGTIYGGGAARFIQNGVLFDGSGKKIAEEVVAPPNIAVKPEEQELTAALKGAHDFLKTALSKGEPVDKEILFEEYAVLGLERDDIFAAFKELGVKETRSKGQVFWQLMKEAA